MNEPLPPNDQLDRPPGDRLDWLSQKQPIRNALLNQKCITYIRRDRRKAEVIFVGQKSLDRSAVALCIAENCRVLNRLCTYVNSVFCALFARLCA